MERRKASAVWKLLVSVLFFALIFRMVRGPEFLAMVHQIRLRYVVLSLVVSGAMIAVSCLKWFLLVRQQEGSISYFRLLRLYFIGYYFSALLPSTVGGDVVRSFYAGRDMSSQSGAAVTVLVERLTGLVLLLLLVLFAPLLVPGLYGKPAFFIPSIGAAGVLVTLLVLLRLRQPLKRAIDAFEAADARATKGPGRSLAGRLGVLLTRLREATLRFHQKLTIALRVLRDTPRLLVPVAGLTVLFYMLTWLNVYVAFLAFDVDPSLRSVIAVVPTSMIVSMIPIAPMASLGLAEGAYVYYFSLVGVPGAASLAMGLLIRGKLLLIGLIGLVCHLTLGDRVEDDVGFREEQT